MSQKTATVRFIVTGIEDTRKMGSIIEIGRSYEGVLNRNTNAIWFDDTNGQSWVFWVGDTCQLEEDPSTSAHL